jgi:hypothetical protein
MFSGTASAAGVASCQLSSPLVPTFLLGSTVGTLGGVDFFCTNTGFSGAPIASLDFHVGFNVSNVFGSPTLTQGSNTYSGFNISGIAYDPNQPFLDYFFQGAQVNPSQQGPGIPYFETITFDDPTLQFNGPIISDPNVLVAVNALSIIPIRRFSALTTMPEAPNRLTPFLARWDNSLVELYRG